jgi:hypothetical protein
MSKKEKFTYMQQKGSKYYVTLRKKSKKGEVPLLNEIEKMFPHVVAECLNDLDERLQRLEREIKKRKDR